MARENIVLTPEFSEALALVKEQLSAKRASWVTFIDGSAGTGKSTLLKLIRCSVNQAIVAAPTGVAATLVSGTTLHRLFNFPIKVLEPERDRENSHPSPVLRTAKLLIIDEAGMVRADLIDGVDYYLRKATRRSTPFGGIPVVLFGDPAQLPPVVTNDDRPILEHLGYESEHFFSAKVFQNFPLRRVTLTQVFRQSDRHFAELLNRVRIGEPTEEDLAKLNAYVGREPASNKVVTLTTTRAAAAAMNESVLSSLPGKLHTWKAEISGNMRPEDSPAESLLGLKPGALVMLLNNTEEWSNGSLGTFTGQTVSGKLRVRLHSGSDVVVDRHSWERMRYTLDPQKGEIVQRKDGSISQFPVRLAHGMTIHKSQGATLDSVAIDLGDGAFASGQTYVALSRVRSIEGLHLREPIDRSDCRVDSRVREFLEGSSLDQEEDATQQMGLNV